MPTFKCNNCGTVSATRESIEECPKCGSTVIEDISDECVRCGGYTDVPNSRICSKCRESEIYAGMDC